MIVNNIRKVLVIMVIVLPLFAGNSCDSDKCGCSGDVQETNVLIPLNTSDIVYTDNGTSAYFVINNYVYHFCNPVAIYEIYSQIVEDNSPLIEIIGDLYWNCNYTYRRSSSSYYNYYNYTVEYDINVLSMVPILDGK